MPIAIGAKRRCTSHATKRRCVNLLVLEWGVGRRLSPHANREVGLPLAGLRAQVSDFLAASDAAPESSIQDPPYRLGPL